jgi:small subunit ribosomal protein S3
MSAVKRVIKDSLERLRVEELLSEEFEEAGFGGVTISRTPLGTQINLYTMRPGRVIGKRGHAIKTASERLEKELGISNPQITVVEVEVPELNPRIMASRIANALERGVHFRRVIFWALQRIMSAGAIGCEIVLRGKLRSDRSRFEKVTEGYIPKSGEPSRENTRSWTTHVKLKSGVYGITVKIVPPGVQFPDKLKLEEKQLSEGEEPAVEVEEAETDKSGEEE